MTEVSWSEDVCTCGHPVSKHEDRGTGRCVKCENDASYSRSPALAPLCPRYQWNGEPRRRIW